MSTRNIIQALQGAAGAAGGGTLDVDEVFSIDLYTGNGSTQQITNGLDLSSEYGLVWSKERSTSIYNHALVDNVSNKFLMSDNSSAAANASTEISSFNTDGFTLHGTGDYNNVNNRTYVSWSFRKAPKFFDIVQFSTGGSAVEQTINHSLGSTPGMIIIKDDGIGSWYVWHRGIGTTQYLRLESTGAVATYDGVINNVTSTSFTTDVGTAIPINSTAIAYIFAHNNNDGGFGPDSDQDIIKCGSYSGNGSSQHIDLGFEPQWILHRRSNSSAPWRIYDVMRGMPVGSADAYLAADATSAEATYNEAFQPTATGFTVPYSAPYYNASGDTYIYMAIRRGPLAQPESATNVFHVNTRTLNNSTISTNFAADMSLQAATSFSGQDRFIEDRLRGFATDPSSTSGNAMLKTNSTSAETSNQYPTVVNVFNNSYEEGNQNSTLAAVTWMWKRAPSYFDVVAYTGTGSTRTINHNLSAVPEMIWWKERSNTDYWIVYHKDLTSGSYPSQKSYLFLNDYSAASTAYQPLTSAPTSSVLSLSASSGTNGSGETYIAYLFATVANVSKLGSYTGNGSSAGDSQNIECGFSSGARFVLTKNIENSVGNWSVWDTARGLTASPNSYWIRLNGTNAHNNNSDWLEPYSGGFKVVYNGNSNSPNNNGEKYIFYAIA